VGHATARYGLAVVPIDVATGGVPLVTLAPLRVRFDATRLTLRSCTSRQVAVSAAEWPQGQLNIVAYSLTPWPLHRVLTRCTFTVRGDQPGLVPLLATEAGLATVDAVDVTGVVVSGSVLIP
jgi:hypothetical protein